jgi:hypothetical protein
MVHSCSHAEELQHATAAGDVVSCQQSSCRAAESAMRRLPALSLFVTYDVIVPH